MMSELPLQIVSAVKDWQTLIAGAAALAAAKWTIYYMQKQITSSENISSLLISNERYAARAILPVALAAINNYASECISHFVKCLEDKEYGQDIPKLETDTIVSLKDAIKYSDRTHAKKIADVVSLIQIQSSRAQSSKNNFEESFYDRLFDALELYSLSSELLMYGRREAEEGRRKHANVDQMRSAAMIHHLDADEHPRLFEKIDLRGTPSDK